MGRPAPFGCVKALAARFPRRDLPLSKYVQKPSCAITCPDRPRRQFLALPHSMRRRGGRSVAMDTPAIADQKAQSLGLFLRVPACASPPESTGECPVEWELHFR